MVLCVTCTHAHTHTHIPRLYTRRSPVYPVKLLQQLSDTCDSVVVLPFKCVCLWDGMSQSGAPGLARYSACVSPVQMASQQAEAGAQGVLLPSCPAIAEGRLDRAARLPGPTRATALCQGRRESQRKELKAKLHHLCQ